MNASEVHYYGIINFNIKKIVKTLGKEDYELIVERCTTCKTCNREIKENFPHIPITWKYASTAFHAKEMNEYIIEKIMKRIEKLRKE